MLYLQVRNFLPSISSAIGGFTPQRYIWRIFFAVHLTPRFIFALMHYNYNMGFPVTSGLSWFRRLNLLTCVLHCGELIGLVLVTFISSAENYCKSVLSLSSVSYACVQTKVWKLAHARTPARTYAHSHTHAHMQSN